MNRVIRHHGHIYKKSTTQVLADGQPRDLLSMAGEHILLAVGSLERVINGQEDPQFFVESDSSGKTLFSMAERLKQMLRLIDRIHDSMDSKDYSD